MKMGNRIYKTEDMRTCEYISERTQVVGNKYRPLQKNSKCAGYVNPYTKKPSTVCECCGYFDGTMGGKKNGSL